MDVTEFLDELRVSAREKYIPVMRKRTTEKLKELVSSRRPNEVLEIGTSLGVSGITVLTSGAKKLTTIDINGDIIAEAEKNFTLCGVRDRVDFIEGDCFEVLNIIGGNRYDMVILDGPKGHYYDLYLRVLPMLNKGGIIFCDDVDYFGWVKDGREDRKHRAIINGMKKFYEMTATDERVDAEFLPIEDGVAVITLKNTEEK